jgi:hypothetical protein
MDLILYYVTVVYVARSNRNTRVCSPALFTVPPRLKRLIAEELTIFWNARPCNLTEVYWRFGRKYCPNLFDEEWVKHSDLCMLLGLFPVLFDPEDEAVRPAETSKACT